MTLILRNKEIYLYLEFNENGEVSPPTLWDISKAVLRGKILEISTYKKKTKNELLENFTNQAEKKKKLNMGQNILEEIRTIRTEINHVFETETL